MPIKPLGKRPRRPALHRPQRSQHIRSTCEQERWNKAKRLIARSDVLRARIAGDEGGARTGTGEVEVRSIRDSEHTNLLRCSKSCSINNNRLRRHQRRHARMRPHQPRKLQINNLRILNLRILDVHNYWLRNCLWRSN